MKIPCSGWLSEFTAHGRHQNVIFLSGDALPGLNCHHSQLLLVSEFLCLLSLGNSSILSRSSEWIGHGRMFELFAFRKTCWLCSVFSVISHLHLKLSSYQYCCIRLKGRRDYNPIHFRIHLVTSVNSHPSISSECFIGTHRCQCYNTASAIS